MAAVRRSHFDRGKHLTPQPAEDEGGGTDEPSEQAFGRGPLWRRRLSSVKLKILPKPRAGKQRRARHLESHSSDSKNSIRGGRSSVRSDRGERHASQPAESTRGTRGGNEQRASKRPQTGLSLVSHNSYQSCAGVSSVALT